MIFPRVGFSETVLYLRYRINTLKDELNDLNGRLERVEEHHEESESTEICRPNIDLQTKNILPNKIDFGPAEPSGKDIRALTNVKEECLLWNEIESNVSLLPELDEDVLKSLAGSFVVEITNLMDSDLIQPEYNSSVDNNLTAGDLPESINAGTRVILKASPKLVATNILLAYTICNNSNLRIVLSFSHESHIGVALAPTELAFQRLVFFAFINDDMGMINQISDRRWTDYTKVLNVPDDEARIIVRNQNILVGVKLAYTSMPTVQVKLVNIKESGSLLLNSSCPSSPESLAKFIRNNTAPTASGKTNFWKTDGILEHVLETYGVVVEINNLLNVALNRPSMYLVNGQPFLLPKMVNKNSKDVLIAITNHSGFDSGGVISFRMGTTDLMLAVAFQIYNNGNRFGVGFLPMGVQTDRNLLMYMTSNNQWKTSPDQKFGQASEGELVIETRNIRARVTMTNDLKAVVNIIVKTF